MLTAGLGNYYRFYGFTYYFMGKAYLGLAEKM